MKLSVDVWALTDKKRVHDAAYGGNSRGETMFRASLPLV